MPIQNPIVFLGGGTIAYFCCCRQWLNQDFGELSTEKPTGETLYFHRPSGQLVPAAVFPNQNGTWNVTIKETEETLRLGIVGLQLMDVDEKDVYIEEPGCMYCGRTGQEWFSFLPIFCIKFLPVILASTLSCPDIPHINPWIITMSCFLWTKHLLRFTFRISDPSEGPKTCPKRLYKILHLALLSFAVWGATMTWPRIGKGLMDELDDCHVPLYYMCFMPSTLFCTAIFVLLSYKFCNNIGCYQKVAYYFEDDLTLIGETSKHRFDMEMSVSEL